MSCESCEESAYVIDKLAKLLAEIAVIVNGPEPPLTSWSYHDLPEKVRALKQAPPAAVPVADALRDSLGAMEAHARMYPHMDKGFMVDARNKAKRALSTQAPPAECNECKATPCAVPAGYVPVSALIEAREEVESWAAYATPYFQDKHGLAEVLAKIDGQIAAAQAQQPAAAVPGLHPRTADLVQRFATALAEKLAAAEAKYGYSDGWADSEWMDECRAKLIEHVEKGDPRDVAAYCAFLWHHGERTALPAPPPAGLVVVPEGGLRDSVLNSAKFRASCYALVGIVEGIQGLGRCWAANGERLKDTPEWVAFYNCVAAMRNGTFNQASAEQAPPAAAVVPADDAIEAAYWDFDARHKGYGPHKTTPQSERDAFKWAVRALLAAAARKGVGVSHEN